MQYKIYKLTSPSKKYYIGYTKNSVSDRFKQHVSSWKRWVKSGRTRKAVSTKLYYGFDSNDPDQWVVETIYETDSYQDCCAKEDELIALHECIVNGYNLIPGGHGGKGKKLDEEHKTKLAEARLKYYESESGQEWLKKLAEINKARPKKPKKEKRKYRGTEEHRTECSERMKKVYMEGKKVGNGRIPGTTKNTENQKKTVQKKLSATWRITHPDGTVEIVEILKEWTAKMGFNHLNAQSNMSSQGKYKGYKAEKI